MGNMQHFLLLRDFRRRGSSVLRRENVSNRPSLNTSIKEKEREKASAGWRSDTDVLHIAVAGSLYDLFIVDVNRWRYFPLAVA